MNDLRPISIRNKRAAFRMPKVLGTRMNTGLFRLFRIRDGGIEA